MKYVAIVAVVVILIVAGVWYFSRQRKGPESAGPSQAQATAPLIAPVHVEQWQELNPQGYVNDFANVLNTTTVQGLTRLSAEVDQKAKVQIAVVTIKTLEGDNVEDFANHLFNKWGVGYKGTDRGVMVLLATDDHKYRTEVGYGLERILSNDKVGGFGLDMVPLLRRGDYDGAIDQIVGQIAQVIAQDSHISLDSLANFHPVTHATTLGVTTDRRNQIEAAKRQGDNYYDNGEYDKAINAYQVGLKLAPTNAPLLQALRRAQTAKAAEVKFNQ
jgi:tetratricopeptide (TPR) repeat protein